MGEDSSTGGAPSELVAVVEWSRLEEWLRQCLDRERQALLEASSANMHRVMAEARKAAEAAAGCAAKYAELIDRLEEIARMIRVQRGDVPAPQRRLDG
jgi:hypothetical protein